MLNNNTGNTKNKIVYWVHNTFCIVYALQFSFL